MSKVGISSIMAVEFNDNDKGAQTMLPKEKLNRINMLAKKAKETGLTEQEAKEQSTLRREYLETFRSSMFNTLKGVTIVDPNGNDVTPKKLKEVQKKNLH